MNESIDAIPFQLRVVRGRAYSLATHSYSQVVRWRKLLCVMVRPQAPRSLWTHLPTHETAALAILSFRNGCGPRLGAILFGPMMLERKSTAIDTIPLSIHSDAIRLNVAFGFRRD